MRKIAVMLATHPWASWLYWVGGARLCRVKPLISGVPAATVERWLSYQNQGCVVRD